MKSFNLSLKAFLCMFMLAFAAGCEDNTRALDDAQTAIERAKSVEADLYAADLYKSSTSNYTKAESALKEENTEVANEYAVTSKEEADKAYDNSLQNRAEYYYTRATSLMKEAKRIKMDKIKPSTYKKYNNTYNTMTGDWNDKDYAAVYKVAPDFVVDLAADIEKLKIELQQAQNILEQARAYYNRANKNANIKSNYADELAKANTLINDGKTDYDNGLLDDSTKKAEKAIDILSPLIEKGGDKTAAPKKERLSGLSQKDQAEKILDQAKSLMKKMNYDAKGQKYPNVKCSSNLNTDKVQDTYDTAEAAYKSRDYAKSSYYAIETILTIKCYLQEGRLYTVEKGDTLWDLSESNYNNPWIWESAIYDENDFQIKDPHWIYPLQQFFIPKLDANNKPIMK